MIKKEEILKVLQDKLDLIIEYPVPEDLQNNLKKISEFHYSLREYFSLLGSLCITPLALFVNLEKKIGLSTPAWYWIEQFLESTDPKINKSFTGMKAFIFIQNGKHEMEIAAVNDLKTAISEAKRHLKDLNTHAYHYLNLIDQEDLNYGKNLRKKESGKYFILFEQEAGILSYNGKVLVALVKSKLPYQILTEHFKNPGGIPIASLYGYPPDDIDEGIRNFKKNLKRKLKTLVTDRKISDSFIVKKPTNKIIVDDIFILG